MSRDRKRFLLLYVAGLLLYAPAIWWGLPEGFAKERMYPWGLDELGPLGPIAQPYLVLFGGNAEFNPQYTLFHYLVQAIFCVPYVGYLYLTGGLGTPKVEFPFGLADPETALGVLTVLARLPSLLMAAGLPIIAFKTAVTLWNRRTGWIASLLALLYFPTFFYARTSNVDMGAFFWTALGVMVFVRCMKDTLTPGRAVWLGVLAALATATKDASYAAFVSMALFIVPLHIVHNRRRGGGFGGLVGVPLLGLLSTTVVYAAVSGVLLHPEKHWIHIKFVLLGAPGMGHYFSMPATREGFQHLATSTMGHIRHAMGLPVFLLAWAGVARCAMRDRWKLAIACVGIGIYLGTIVVVRFVVFRFILIVAYLFLFFAAYALAEAWSSRRDWLRKAAPAICAGVCAWGFLGGADLTYQMLFDSRYQAVRWLEENALDGERIGYYGYPLRLPSPFTTGIGAVEAPISGVPVALGEDQLPEYLLIMQTYPEYPVDWPSRYTYRSMKDGILDYEKLVELQAGSLFWIKPIRIVDPRIEIWGHRQRPAVTEQQGEAASRP